METYKQQFEMNIPVGYKVTGLKWTIVEGDAQGKVEGIISVDKPQYKAFEIDWSGDNPTLPNSAYITRIGRLFDGYRIFGYGNESDADEASVPCNHVVVPCNYEENFKYAYGRLEK